ncbi:MAG: alpha/beta hydrolase [Saprospiraceae bacterium]|nr:alpha/beta hydrolase [Saprospiraceae bacterium]
MVERTILVEQHLVNYLKYGTKPKYLIALHGYGSKASAFQPLTNALTTTFTVLAIDLPFHGKTIWKSNSYTKKQLVDVINQVLTNEKASDFSFLGYSLGARIIQTLFLHFEHRVEAIFLIAPDGISNKWYFNTTLFPKLIRQKLNQWLYPSEKILRAASIFYKAKLISKSSYQFIHVQLQTSTRQTRMFGTWVSLVEFVPNLSQLKQRLRQADFPVYLFCSKNDEIVPFTACLRLAKDLPHLYFYPLQSDHYHIINEELGVLLEQVLSSSVLTKS